MNLSRLTDSQLYRLSFDISEELIEREQRRMLVVLATDNRRIVGRYEIARPTPKPINTRTPW